MRKLTAEEFINRAKSIHGDSYDYSRVDYRTCSTPVEIICPDHGSFFQTPNNHYRNNCPKCWESRKGKSQRRTTDWFIEKSKETFGDKYDYSMSEYITANDTITIICEQHGPFKKYPHGHIAGEGCSKCSGYNLNTEDWVERFVGVHGTRYDYSGFVFTRATDKSIINCHLHGPFWQSPSKHVNGRGCPECCLDTRSDNWDAVSSYGILGYYGTDKPSNFYILDVEGDFIKVGLSVNIRHRINKLRYDSGYEAQEIFSFPGKANHLYYVEQKILQNDTLNKYKTERRFNGSLECFCRSDVEKIKELFWEYYNESN